MQTTTDAQLKSLLHAAYQLPPTRTPTLARHACVRLAVRVDAMRRVVSFLALALIAVAGEELRNSVELSRSC